MRIVSSFKDYYDGVMGAGMDLTRLYVREPAVEERPAGHPYVGRVWEDNVKMVLRVVGFCGQQYLAVEVEAPRVAGTPHKVCYDLADIDAFVAAHYDEADQDRYYDKTAHRWDRRPRAGSWPWFYNRRGLHKMFTDFPPAKPETFTDRRCPVFLAEPADIFDTNRGAVVTWNACLKPVEFFRKYPPFEAYQEIAMWLGNLADPAKPIPAIDDVTMAEAKGFDKFSFRKDKKKK